METRTLFMIGNGFDLEHGLRTSYMDFFYYLEELRKSSGSNTPSLFAHYLDFNEVNLIINHPISTGIIEILHLDDSMLMNVWCSYFESVINREENLETWIDFEKEIQSLILQIEEYQNSNPHRCISTSNLQTLLNCTSPFFLPPKVNYLNNKLSIDSHLANKLFYKELSLFLYDELRRYTFCFELYLACIMPILPSKFPQHTPDPLFRFFETGTRNNFLLSFNYTTTTEERYKIANIQYIHGKLRNPDELEAHMLESDFQLSTPLILGFHSDNPDSDTNPTPFLFFEKFFQRILHETKDYIYSWINNSTQNCQFRTVIYGHSLDSSDGDFIKLIFEKSCSITVYFHDPGVLPSLITNLVSIFGREEVNRIHSQGKLRFVPADILKVGEPEANYAPI